MPRPADLAPVIRPALAIAAAAVVVALGAAGAGPVAFDRLRALPLRQRRALDEALGRFDRLDADERAAIRAVDRRLAGLDAVERARLLDRLRRYHLWVEALPEARRDELRKAAPADRVEFVRAFLRDESARRAGVAGSVAMRSQALNPGTLTDAAFQVRCWRALGPDDRDRIETIVEKPPGSAQRRRQELVNLGHSKGLFPEPAFFQPTIDVVRDRLVDPKRRAAFFDEFRDELVANAKANPQQKGQEVDALLALLADPQLRDAVLNPAANAAPLKALPADKRNKLTANRNGLRMKFREKLVREAEAEYLARNDLEPVAPAKLREFLEAVPPWIEQAVEVLPADEARLKLTALYRLVEAAEAAEPRPSRPAAARRAARLRGQAPPAPTSPAAGPKPS